MTIVPYFALTSIEIRNIVKLKIERIRTQFKESHEANLTFDPEISDVIAKRCLTPDTGARAIDAIIDQNLLPKIAEKILGLMAAGEKFTATCVTLDENQEFIISHEY